jgi:choline-sulfatase
MKRFSLALSLLLLLSGCRERREQSVWPKAPVIIISVDTLRADRLPAYGYDRVDTPHIDALRRDGILFTNAYAQVPLTLPSHLSLLTGTLPAEHGVRNNVGYRFDPSQHATLQSELKNAGYRTGAAISAYVLRSSTGIAEGFDFYDDAIAVRAGAAIGSLQRPGTVTLERARQWLDASVQLPFFFLFHIFEPHAPYEPPEPFRTRYGSPYDGEVAAADAVVGQLIERLKASGVYERAIIIFLSDHGEGLNDHGEPEHGIFVYREAIHVPLIVKLPGRARAGETIARPVGLLDVAPTVLALTGRPVPPSMKTPSLLEVPKEGARRSVYAESMYGRIHLGWSELRSLIDEDYQYIEAPRPELYSNRNDPAQKNNILAENRRVYARMRQELAAIPGEFSAPGAVDPEERAKLAALGYLGATTSPQSGPFPDPKDRIGEIGAMFEATRLSREGRIDESIAALRAIVQENPRFADAWNLLAMTLDRQGRYEEAAEAYRKAIDVDPALAGEFALSLGGVLLKLERYDDAEAHARLAEKSNPAGAHVLLARIALERRDLAGAEREARKAASLDPFAAPGANIVVAQAVAQQGRLPEALALIESVRRDAEQKQLGAVESLEFTRGDILARMERLEEAAAAFRREIELFPQNRQPYGNLALVYMLMGRTDQAHALFEQMVRANPGRRSLLFAAKTFDDLDDPRSAAVWRRRAEASR